VVDYPALQLYKADLLACATVMEQASSENFPVASRLLPIGVRRHLLAVYGFARLVDDAGDESDGDRMALLDVIEADVDRIFAGEVPRHPLMRRLLRTVRECALDDEPLRALIAANRRDQRQLTYETFDDLLEYCTLSANPVGHLVLGVFGVSTPERRRLSDAICTGLQLAEHWQDVAEDLSRGRIYLPAEDLRSFGCTESDLAVPSAGEPVRTLMAFEVRRARALLDEGAPLIATLRGRQALAVVAFVAGGRAALDAIERVDYDVLRGTPRATRWERAWALAGAFEWRTR
jgi:squalene synthase HpnC